MIKQTKKPVIVEHVHYDAAGKQCDVEVHGYPIFDDDGKLIQMIEYSIDVTDKKMMEEELVKSKKLEATAILGGGIAHDFNNLLTIILGNLFLAEEQVDPAGTTYNLLKGIEEASIKARSLTQQFITFSKGGTPVREVSSIR
jgi:signal transduction histidine kinase